MDRNLIIGDFAGSRSTYNLSGGQLSAGEIKINGPASGGGNGTFNVMNTITTVTGDVENFGTVKTTNAIVTWDGNFTNNVEYISDPSTQDFKNDLTVNDPGYIQATNNKDLFLIRGDFINTTANSTDWNTVKARLRFAKGGVENDTYHEFSIVGADGGPTNPNAFEWRVLNITNQDITLVDGDGGSDGALYLQVLRGADVSVGPNVVNNISTDDAINIYYNSALAANLYLGGLDYALGGSGGGMLIHHTPLPPSVLLLGSGLLGLGLLGWRRKRG